MGDIIGFLETMPFWYWWVLAITLLIVEISTGTTYVLWPAVAAALVGVVCIFQLDGAWEIQLALFAGLTLFLTIFATPYAKRWLHNTKTDHEMLNQRGAQKIGKRATVVTEFANGKGKVTYGDTQWLAESESGQDFEIGAKVEITDVRGTLMIVKAV